MRQFLDLDRFPLDSLDGVGGRALLARCRRDLRETGMFNLPGLIRPEALERCRGRGGARVAGGGVHPFAGAQHLLR